MAHETDAVRLLVCRLLAHQTLPRTDDMVRRLFVDATYREAVETLYSRLDSSWPRTSTLPISLCEWPVSSKLPVFEDGKGSYWSNNVGLSAGAMALLTILWSLLILPKRQHQQEQGDAPDDGAVGGRTRQAEIDLAIERKTLEADFGHLFGSQIRFHGYVSELKRRGFIHERRGKITEGPLLDVLVDYSTLAPRIIEGALSRVLAARFDQGPAAVLEEDPAAAEADEESC